jgi:hypothetical protein
MVTVFNGAVSIAEVIQRRMSWENIMNSVSKYVEGGFFKVISQRSSKHTEER